MLIVSYILMMKTGSIYLILIKLLLELYFRRRRASLQLPSVTLPRAESRSSVKGRWKETLESIRNFTLPSNLFRRRPTSPLDKSMSSNPLPLMKSALTIPFFSVSRDEHEQKAVPVLLEAVNVYFRDMDLDSLESGGHQQFHIRVTYGDLSW